MRRDGWMGLMGLSLLLGCQTEPSGPQDAATVAGIQAVGAGIGGAASGSAHLAIDFGVPLPPGLSLRNFTFEAISHRDGSVKGQWQVVAGSSILHGQIDCLMIAEDGASARLSGLVNDAKFTTFLPGTAFAMEIQDNGNGGSGDPDVTTQLRAFRNADPAVGRAFCLDGVVPPGEDLDPLPTDHGNFSIRPGS